MGLGRLCHAILMELLINSELERAWKEVIMA
jgi:hypothetical protein